MIFNEVKLKGAYEIRYEKIHDHRGYFFSSYSENEFSKKDLNTKWVSQNNSYNKLKGTVRGLHYQNPYPEIKLVRCIKGSLLDVMVDLRPDSPTYLDHYMTILTDTNNKSVYIPEYFAHGFQTLEPETVISYIVSESWRPEHYKGIRYNDPKLNIKWLVAVTAVSAQDSSWELL